MRPTPIEWVDGVAVKRGDLYKFAGVNGGKIRVIQSMACGAAGLITSGPRRSSQIYIGARVANVLGIPFRCHLPSGPFTAEMEDVLEHGGEVIQHRCGYNNVLSARAVEDMKGRIGWVMIPLWLRCMQTVKEIRSEVYNIPRSVKRVVVTVGSGMSAAAILHGLRDIKLDISLIGVCVGASPTKTMNTFAPFGWRNQCTLVASNMGYKDMLSGVCYGGIPLDPRYEAKAASYVQKGDLFWIVAHGIHYTRG